jgi:hypothetical protein
MKDVFSTCRPLVGKLAHSNSHNPPPLSFGNRELGKWI